MSTEGNILISKQVMPTSLKSDDIRQLWSDKMREDAFFSAQTTEASYLEFVKQLLKDFRNGFQTLDNGQTITLDENRVRMLMREKLAELGLVERDASGNVAESITNLASKMRLELIIETNKSLAHNKAMKEFATTGLQPVLRPAFELVRNGAVENPRNWWARWTECAELVNYRGVAPLSTGRMVALVNSPIWSELGHHYDDSLDTDVPPFAFGSKMGWKSIKRKECVELGMQLDE